MRFPPSLLLQFNRFLGILRLHLQGTTPRIVAIQLSKKTKISFQWIPWAVIGVCAILVTIILPERLYAFWFYLIIVGCGEEFVFRGYLHREVRKTFNFKVSVILGGLVFGFAHGYSHFMIQGGTITGILSELGGGIVGALVFSAIYEKSNSIGWSILILE